MSREVKTSQRTFIVDGDEVTRLSQAKCDAFILNGEPALLGYAGQTITLVTAAYELRDGKPWQIFHLETSRHRVAEDGSLDEDFWRESLDLQMKRTILRRVKVQSDRSVVDAKTRFDQRRLESLHPTLSGLAHRRVLEALFGGVP